MKRRQFVATLAGAAVPLLAIRPLLASQATAPASAALRTTLQALLEGYITSKRLAGAAAGYSMGGAPMTYVGAGQVALDADVPFDENSVCRIYSMTKPVTGVATMLLIEGGKLTLDQPVADILPELKHLQVAVDPSKGVDARPATRGM